MLRKRKLMTVSSMLLAIVSLAYSAKVNAFTPEISIHPMCTRVSWAITDKCKDPAVATKNAPKDLKKRLKDLLH